MQVTESSPVRDRRSTIELHHFTAEGRQPFWCIDDPQWLLSLTILVHSATVLLWQSSMLSVHRRFGLSWSFHTQNPRVLSITTDRGGATVFTVKVLSCKPCQYADLFRGLCRIYQMDQSVFFWPEVGIGDFSQETFHILIRRWTMSSIIPSAELWLMEHVDIFSLLLVCLTVCLFVTNSALWELIFTILFCAAIHRPRSALPSVHALKSTTRIVDNLVRFDVLIIRTRDQSIWNGMQIRRCKYYWLANKQKR